MDDAYGIERRRLMILPQSTSNSATHIPAGEISQRENRKFPFVPLGYLVKKWPQEKFYGIDDECWPENIREKDRIRNKFDLTENAYGLLDINREIVARVSECVRRQEGCRLILFAVPRDVIGEGWDGLAIDVSESQVKLEMAGYDICDLNGMFSLLHAEFLVKERGVVELFGEIDRALFYNMIIGYKDIGHSPSCIVQVLLVD